MQGQQQRTYGANRGGGNHRLDASLPPEQVMTSHGVTKIGRYGLHHHHHNHHEQQQPKQSYNSYGNTKTNSQLLLLKPVELGVSKPPQQQYSNSTQWNNDFDRDRTSTHRTVGVISNNNNNNTTHCDNYIQQQSNLNDIASNVKVAHVLSQLSSESGEVECVATATKQNNKSNEFSCVHVVNENGPLNRYLVESILGRMRLNVPAAASVEHANVTLLAANSSIEDIETADSNLVTVPTNQTSDYINNNQNNNENIDVEKFGNDYNKEDEVISELLTINNSGASESDKSNQAKIKNNSKNCLTIEVNQNEQKDADLSVNQSSSNASSPLNHQHHSHQVKIVNSNCYKAVPVQIVHNDCDIIKDNHNVEKFNDIDDVKLNISGGNNTHSNISHDNNNIHDIGVAEDNQYNRMVIVEDVNNKSSVVSIIQNVNQALDGDNKVELKGGEQRIYITAEVQSEGHNHKQNVAVECNSVNETGETQEQINALLANSREQRRRERRERRAARNRMAHVHASNVMPAVHPHVMATANGLEILPDLLHSHLPPPYTTLPSQPPLTSAIITPIPVAAVDTCRYSFPLPMIRR